MTRTLKIISLNIWGGRLLEQAVDFLLAEHPDAILLQEVYRSRFEGKETFEHLATLLPEYQGIHAPTYSTKRRGGQVEMGNAVFTTLPIQSQRTVFYDIPYMEDFVEPENRFELVPRNLQHVVLEWEESSLNIFNTHGIWGKNGKDTDRRLAMSQKIVQETKMLPRTILAGDFNLDPKTRSISQIEQNLTNIFKDEIKTTFNLTYKTNPVFQGLVVDMMFASQDLILTSRACPAVNVSDHLPLITTFTSSL